MEKGVFIILLLREAFVKVKIVRYHGHKLRQDLLLLARGRLAPVRPPGPAAARPSSSAGSAPSPPAVPRSFPSSRRVRPPGIALSVGGGRTGGVAGAGQENVFVLKDLDKWLGWRRGWARRAGSRAVTPPKTEEYEVSRQAG